MTHMLNKTSKATNKAEKPKTSKDHNPIPNSIKIRNSNLSTSTQKIKNNKTIKTIKRVYHFKNNNKIIFKLNKTNNSTKTNKIIPSNQPIIKPQNNQNLKLHLSRANK
jgi:cell division protein FtsX